LDVRLGRVFRIGERWKFLPELDIYNLLNRATFMGENTSVNAGALFLNPQTVLPPRLFKIGMKVDF
jgi:hypothetical protein